MPRHRMLALACFAFCLGDAPAQESGDPERGRRAFLEHGFETGGIPVSVFERLEPMARPLDPWLRLGFDRLPDRTGENGGLPMQLSVREVGGQPLATSNCMTCHVGPLLGKWVVGLGAHTRDFTRPAAPFILGGLFGVRSLAEWREYARWSDRALGIAPYVRTTTRGLNPADHFAGYLWAHRDPETLEWLDEPTMRLPPTDPILETDVPPLWRTAKKRNLYYTGGGRGEHARLIMSALVLFTDSTDEAEREVPNFRDMLAFIRTIEPPRWPWPVDEAKAARGRRVFEGTCTPCHGTYGEVERYPELIVPIGIAGTDPLLAQAEDAATDYLDWYNRSWFGETSRLEHTDGYVAPPLDGIWATAPFLHNGSVPTLLDLLDSKRRPTYWTRSFDPEDYDREQVGWRFERLARGRDAHVLPSIRAAIYDTTRPGLSNGGHTFGDHLSEEQRLDLLEYLKTL